MTLNAMTHTHLTLISGLSMLLLVGCASTPHHVDKATQIVDTPLTEAKPTFPELDFLPDDAARSALLSPIQLSYANRGVYLSQNGDLNFLGARACDNLQLHSHRGHPKEAENSVRSIKRALLNRFDAIEIDIRQLNTGEWVLHHDEKTGRATGRKDGLRTEINTINFNEWHYIAHRDPETGALLPHRAATLLEALAVFRRYALPHQVLHVEIKGGQFDALDHLDYILDSQLGATSRYMYSASNYEALMYLRKINSSVYLGYIRPAHPRSIEILKEQAKALGAQDPLYHEINEEVQHYERLAKRYGRYRFDADRLIKDVRRDLGENAGIHLDIREYGLDPALTRKAKSVGLRSVLTWTINGQRYHLNEVKKHKNADRLPTGSIIDDDVFGFCANLTGITIKNTYDTPSAFNTLPANADLRQILQQSTYLSKGMYYSLDQQVLPLPSAPSSLNTASPTLSIPTRDRGEANAGTITPIKIKLDKPTRGQH